MPPTAALQPPSSRALRERRWALPARADPGIAGQEPGARLPRRQHVPLEPGGHA